MCTLGETSIEILFQKRMFHFSAETIGYFGSLSGVMQCLSMLAMPPLFFRVFGSHLQDITWAQMGLCWKALYYALFGLAQRGEQLFLVLLLLLFCGPIVPRTRSYLSKAVRSTEQTELFVAIAALEALGAALGPSLTFGQVMRHVEMIFTFQHCSTNKQRRSASKSPLYRGLILNLTPQSNSAPFCNIVELLDAE